MNRRRQKKRSVNYIEVMQNTLANFDVQAGYLRIKRGWLSLPRFHQRALMVLVCLVIVISVLPAADQSGSNGERQGQGQKRVALTLNAQTDSGAQHAADTTSASERRSLGSTAWAAYTIKNGDTLSKIFRQNGLSLTDLHALIRVEGRDHPLSDVKPGQLIRYKLTTDGALDILQLEKKDKAVMFFRLSNGTFGRSK